MKQIKFVHIEHRNEKRLLVKFAYDMELTAIIRKVEGATFSNTHKNWHVANTPENIEKLLRLFKDVAIIDASEILVTETLKPQTLKAVKTIEDSALSNKPDRFVKPVRFKTAKPKPNTKVVKTVEDSALSNKPDRFVKPVRFKTAKQGNEF